MQTYERPEILATYTVEELVAEATVCMSYGGNGGGGNGGGGNGGGPGFGGGGGGNGGGGGRRRP